MKKYLVFIAIVLLVGFPLFKALAFEDEAPMEESSSFHESEDYSAEDNAAMDDTMHSESDEENINSNEDNIGYSDDYNTYYGQFNYLPVWFYLYLFSSESRNDNFNTVVYFPYVLVLDKTTKQYNLRRYIGANNQTEAVSSQEAAGLAWLKGQINY